MNKGETMDNNVLWILVISVVVFLICREITCWYWKINKVILLLETIAENTSNEAKENNNIE